MKRIILVALASILVACGGDGEEKTIYLTDSAHDGESELKVFIQGYSGEASVSVDGARFRVSGEAVNSLGYYAEGTPVVVSLDDYDSAYNCAYTNRFLTLLDREETVLFHCYLPTTSVKPYISGYSYAHTWRLDAPIEFRISTETQGTGSLLGYRFEVVSAPEGGTLTHLSEFSPSLYQFLSVDAYGEYVIDIYAYTEGASSDPARVSLSVTDEVPTLHNLSFHSADIYTNTDAVATVTVWDNSPSEVTTSYVWTINGADVEGVDGETLSSSLFVKGDVITVQAAAVDLSGNTATSDEISTTVLDSPTAISLDNIPTSIDRGNALNIPIQVVDLDNDETGDVLLTYGPPGMAIEAGYLVWHGDPILMAERGDFYFGLAHSSFPETIFEGEIRVNSMTPNVHTIAALSFDVSALAEVGRTVDFDGNGNLETLVYGPNSIAMFELNNPVRQTWAYSARSNPDSTRSITGVTFVPQSSGEMLVAYLTDRVTLLDPVSGSEVAESEIKNFSGSFSSGLTFVRDGSGGGMIVISHTESGSYNQSLYGLNRETLEVNWQSMNGYLGGIALVANLDDDPQDEIVTTNGFVFDGLSGENQWIMPFPNSNNGVTALYSDSLGRNLLVRNGESSGTVFIIDALEKTYVSKTVADMYNFSIYSRNVDGDSDDELIFKSNSSYLVMDYTPATETLVEATSYALVGNRGVYEINDLAGESNELATFSGDLFSVHTPVVSTAWQDNEVEHCDDLDLASRPQAVLSNTIHFAGSCSSRISLVPVDVTDNQTSLNAIGPGYVDAASYGFLDADSNPDMAFVSSSNLYIYDVSLHAVKWQTYVGFQTSQLATLDVNNDGAAEILLTLEDVINIYDHVGQSIRHQVPSTSATSSSYNDILRFETYTDSAVGLHYLIVATRYDVRVFTMDGDSLDLFASVEMSNVMDFVLADANDDGTPEVVVHRYAAGEYHLDTLDLSLVSLHSSTLPYGLSVITAVPEEVSLRASLVGMRSVNGARRLVGVDVISGKVYWQGPVFSGGADYSTDFRNTSDGLRMIVGGGNSISLGK